MRRELHSVVDGQDAWRQSILLGRARPSHGLDLKPHQLWVELAARPAVELLEGFFDRARSLVGPRVRDRVERVRHPNDPGLDWNVDACDPIGIARPVEVLVVPAGDPSCKGKRQRRWRRRSERPMLDWTS